MKAFHPARVKEPRAGGGQPTQLSVPGAPHVRSGLAHPYRAWPERAADRPRPGRSRMAALAAGHSCTVRFCDRRKSPAPEFCAARALVPGPGRALHSTFARASSPWICRTVSFSFCGEFRNRLNTRARSARAVPAVKAHSYPLICASSPAWSAGAAESGVKSWVPMATSVTRIAVPIAAEICCAVLAMAEPCEYHFGGSWFRAEVMTGISASDNPNMRMAKMVVMKAKLVSNETRDSMKVVTVTTASPDSARYLAPKASKSRPVMGDMR